MIRYPIPMQVHVIWHPRGDALCRPLAERIYLTLNRDPHQPLLPGINMPVFFRCAGADSGDVTSVPHPISVPDTKLDLRIALVTEHLVVDPAWREYLNANSDEVDQNPDEAIFFSVDLSRGGLEGERLSVRLDPSDPRLAERLLQHVLLQCCRLLGGRGRGDPAEQRGAAPLKLFLSHTKRDPEGLEIATAIKAYLDTLAVDRFFDAVSIQPGDYLTRELQSAIAESAVVCIRTDNYVASPWCRQELSFARRRRRPMVVIDALARREPRSSSLLAHLPGVRLAQGGLDQARLEPAVNYVILEIVRFLYANAQLTLLQAAGLIPGDAILVTRPPEARDLAEFRSAAPPAQSGPPTFLYPDPMLPAEEATDLEALGALLATPTSFWRERLTGARIRLSLSPGDGDELRRLGLAFHVDDAMRVIARQLLAAGATLHYGGDLFPGSLTEALFEMIGAYNRDGLKLPPLVNHTAWPWYEEIDDGWLAPRLRMLDIRKCVPPPDAMEFSGATGRGQVLRLSGTPQGRYALGRSLTSMRQQAAQATRAMIVLGGKPHSFSGFYPGILEEVLLSIDAGHMVYVLGGFGGAAHLVAAALAGEHPEALTRAWQERISPPYGETLTFYDEKRVAEPSLLLPAIDYDAAVARLNQHGVGGLATANGLNDEENHFLFHTASVDASLYLIMKGLVTMRSKLL